MREKIDALTQNLSLTIVGKSETIRLMLVALLAGGHALLEDVPGVGKTLLAKSLAGSIDGRFQRLQCTPDLLPTDITGTNIWNPKSGEFSFLPGPVFTNVLLADEINRATPRT
ncbi:ATPase [Kalymmatonema gypsitolerans NIES-4073]|nr:ATPase [Scytonema sp. NIES-4073]